MRQIRRKSRNQYSGEETVYELCRREGITGIVHYRWSKEFREAGIARLVSKTRRQATSVEAKELRQEYVQLEYSW